MRPAVVATLFLFAAQLYAQPTPIPGNPEDWMILGIQSYRTQNYSAAVLNFRRAVDMDPSNITAHLYLATSYMVQFVPGVQSPENRAMADHAREEFQAALQLDPNNLTAIVSLASLTYQQASSTEDPDAKTRLLDESRQWYQKAVGIDPRNKEAWYSLGVIAWLKWYPVFTKARADLGMKPEDPGPLPDPAIRADLLSRFGPLLEDGISCLKRALSIDPNYADAMAYVNLIVRERADLRDSAAQYRADIAEADDWAAKASETRRAMSEGFVPPRVARNSSLGGGGGSATGGIAGQRVRFAADAMAEKLVNRVAPVYPQRALQARIQGNVRFSAIVGKDGRIMSLRVVSGHPLLIQAAIDAVNQWVYSPTVVNGQPVEVSTDIDVPFVLGNQGAGR